MKAELPENWIIRPVAVGDFHKGHCELLAQLTSVGEVDEATYGEAINDMTSHGSHVLVVIDETNGRVVASATLLVERKLIHGCSRVGHIEDVVVSKECRGRGIGEILIRELQRLAADVGCYKIILDCAESTTGFYERCGFKRKEVQMRFDVV